MSLAEDRLRGKHLHLQFESQRQREKMLDLSIATTPSVAKGANMMAKMGWKEGQGLGACNQGIIEPIKPKQNFDQKGLGFTKITGLERMHYSAHFERFESVLSMLNDVCEADDSDDEVVDESKTKVIDGQTSMTGIKHSKDVKRKPRSLEKRSKKSSSRIHYFKSVRSKDVSRYSEDDLACILGSKAHALYTADNNDPSLVFSATNGISSSKKLPTSFTSHCVNEVGTDKVAKRVKRETEESTSTGFGFSPTSQTSAVDIFQKSFEQRFLTNYGNAFVKGDNIDGTLPEYCVKSPESERTAEIDVANFEVTSIKRKQYKPNCELSPQEHSSIFPNDSSVSKKKNRKVKRMANNLSAKS